MHTIEIPDKEKVIQFPSEWNECSQEQAQHLLKLAFEVMQGSMSIGEFRIKVFQYFTKIKFGIGYLVRQKLDLNDDINAKIYQLSEQLCGWVFTKQNDTTYELQYDTIVNHFPILLNKYHGPENLLADVTLGEFKTALSILDQYFECKNDEIQATEHLDLFLSVLYRHKESGQKVPFYQHLPDPEIFRRVPVWQKQCITIWFTFCVKCLQTEELTINGIDVDLSVLFPKSENTGSNNRKVNLGWTGILLDIAESGVFGDAITTSQTPLYDVLIFLLKKHQDQKPNDNRKKV
ncbi:hypothetical protein HP439_11445 [Sphingobacterium shayense]|uniref:hypothetical protein n=1 Tax=Sphingobacterium shayense TaxID=626343 RepID=UPI00155563BF|nr:hypothetical protein [Sphingobacterium shayense]NQD71335.1 hypothetical protein [Sphingobacterium shayense]